MTKRVPQGSVLGPVLFVVYMNDLPSVIQADANLYADDTKIFLRIPTLCTFQRTYAV